MPLTNASPQAETDVVDDSGGGSLDSISPNVDRSALLSLTIAVSIQLMCADPTSTPRWATSSRSALANCSTAAFDALYGARPGDAAYAASDDTIST